MKLWVIISVVILNDGEPPGMVSPADPNERGGYFYASKEDCEKELLYKMAENQSEVTVGYNWNKQLRLVDKKASLTCVQLKGPFEPIK